MLFRSNKDTTEKTVFGRIEREEAGRGRQGKEKEKGKVGKGGRMNQKSCQEKSRKLNDKPGNTAL